MANDVLQVNLTSQEFMRDPLPTLARLRAGGPMVRLKLPIIGKIWAATTHAAVNDLLKDDETFVRDARNAGKGELGGMLWWIPGTLRVLSKNMLAHDNPDHRRLRKLVDQAFNRQSVEGLRPRIGVIADELLGRLDPAGPVDLLEGLARPLPLTVICELLGLPEQDRPNFRRWVKALMSVTSVVGIVWAVPGLLRLIRYFRRHFVACRAQPRPGLMTALVQAEQDGDKLSEDELLAMAFLLLAAGFETTVHLIAGSVVALLEHPEQKAGLLADWSNVPAAVEELLRFVSPVQITKPRWTSRDLVFHGQPLRRGDLVMAHLAAANADPERFEAPEQLDLSRSPNPQVGFGTGPHICLGAQLARVETQVTLEHLFKRFPNLSLALPRTELRYTGRIGMRALTGLPVRLN